MANYKQYQRTQRNVTTEQTFRNGMQYTNAPLMDGFWKTMVNYDIDPTGTTIHPRPGFKTNYGANVVLPDGDWYVHHSGILTAVQNQNVDISLRYTLLYEESSKRLLIIDSSDSTIYKEVTILGDVFPRINRVVAIGELHNMPYTGSKDVEQPHATLSGKIFFPSGSGILQLDAAYSNDTVEYTLQEIDPRIINPSEATAIGFNMLQEDPYSMGDVDEGLAFSLTGIVAVDPATDETMLYSTVNTLVKFKALCAGRQHIKDIGITHYTWAFRDLDTGDFIIQQDTTDREITTTVNANRVSISVEAHVGEHNPIATTSIGLYNFTERNTRFFEPYKYYVGNASHITTWQHRIVAWGIPGGRNILFVSQVGAANYFPYPHNCDIFEGDIVACVPFLKDLLVFTEHQLHRVSLTSEGVGYKSEVIQDNLHMSQLDLSTVKTVQNMIFFKSGNYYYMIVPRTNSGEQGALQLAPISTNITELLDDMEPMIRENLIRMYGNITQERPEIVGFNVLQDGAVIRCTYKFKLGAYYVDVMLNYSTVLRTWTVYVLESSSKNIYIRKSDVTSRTDYASIIGNSFRIISPTPLDIVDDFLGTTTLHNLQLLDTGYRDINSQFKKRFREVQFKINNVSKKSLQFGTEFRIDEYIRKNLHSYNITTEGDYVRIVPEYLDPVTSAGTTVFEEQNTMYIPEVDYTVEQDVVQLITNAWQLDVSSMAEVSIKKIRLGVSGKGYSPRFILVSLNKEFYELMSFNWVYRSMNAR